MLHIAVLDSLTLGEDVDLSLFHQFGHVEIFEKTSPDELAQRIKGKDVVIANKVELREVLDTVENLKLICVAATGVNNVDLTAAKAKHIAVTNIAGYSTASVVQHTFAMLFYLSEKLRYFDDFVRNGDYEKSGMFTHYGRKFTELEGKTWGIIGLGEIGKKVAAVATAFGCKVIYYSSSGKNQVSEYARVDLDTLLQSADVISIHAPLNDQTKYLIGYEELKKMKKTAYLLNLGRGGIVHEADLARALNEDQIAGAGLDVLEVEPRKADCPLKHVTNHEKLLITPHIAFTSVEARARLVGEIAKNIQAFLEGKERNRVV